MSVLKVYSSKFRALLFAIFSLNLLIIASLSLHKTVIDSVFHIKGKNEKRVPSITAANDYKGNINSFGIRRACNRLCELSRLRLQLVVARRRHGSLSRNIKKELEAVFTLSVLFIH